MTDVLLDLNVVLDVFLARQPWDVEATAIFEANRQSRIVAHFSSASVPTLFYVVRKHRGLALAHIAVAESLRSLTIIPVDSATLRLALAQTGSDFEDNLQIACALREGLHAIVTRDPKGFAASPVLALSPGDFLARIAGDVDD